MSGEPLPAGEAEEGAYRIGEAADIVGVEPHVLRYWETEFGIAPERTATGQRLYRRLELDLFLKIRRLLHEERFTIAGARQALLEGVVPPGMDEGAARRALQRIRAAQERVAKLRARTAGIALKRCGEDG